MLKDIVGSLFNMHKEMKEFLPDSWKLYKGAKWNY